MSYEDLVMLIPSHSLEDFPTELPDAQASSLLNAWITPWHPQLIGTTGLVPRYHRADTPPEIARNRLILIPTKCTDLVPPGWIADAKAQGATVLSNLVERQDYVDGALRTLGGPVEVDPELVRDFFALGFCYLQIELLTRHMRHFNSLDEVHFQREAVAAAQAALAHDTETAQTRLRTCFEILQEARERFYPVESYLLDMCLVIPKFADEHFRQLLVDTRTVNVLIEGRDLEVLEREQPDLIPLLKEAWQRKSLACLGGEYNEGAHTLLPTSSWLWQLAAGRATFERLLGQTPKVWARRRFGLAPPWPPILLRHGYIGALHVALDDGFYPDQEHSKIRWEGVGGMAIEAFTRIPLAADSANSFLRFPVRMSESMDNDHVAAVVFARWPEVKSPWFEDLRRIEKYAPVLGRFVTYEDFFEHTESAGRLSSYDPNEYLSPFYVQAVARQEADPLSRYVRHYARRARYDAAAWCDSLNLALRGQPVRSAAAIAAERAVELAAPEAEPDAVAAGEQALADFEAQATAGFAQLISSGGGSEPGFLLVNTLSFPRTVVVPLPADAPAPQVGGPVKFVQWDQQAHAATVEIPGSGFVWLPRQPAGPPDKPRSTTALAEPFTLRNEFFEAYLSENTGGLQTLKSYGRSPNRVSSQIAYRFQRERSLPKDNPEEKETRSFYSAMRLLSAEVTSTGPSLGEIVTRSEIYDQTNGHVLAVVRQTYRVWRGRPNLEIEVELDPQQLPEGDPWSHYYAARFAWNDSTATLTRSVLGLAQSGFKDQRLESAHYLEIVAEPPPAAALIKGTHRTTLLFHGLPFHRKTGERMLDTILLCAGETQRKFQFSIAVEQSYPMQAARDVIAPPLVMPCNGPLRSANSGWLLHLNAKNVQILSLDNVLEQAPQAADAWDPIPPAAPPPARGCTVRLQETEGRPARVELRCFRTPAQARQRDFTGKTITDLIIRDDCVLVDMTAFELAEVELRW